MHILLDTFDGYLLRIEDSQQLATIGNREFIVSDYLHGRCHIFALAAQEVFGPHALIKVLIDAESGFLLHAYIGINDIDIDARGQIQESDILDYEAQGGFEIDHVVLSHEQVLSQSSACQWGAPETGEIDALKDFISLHKSVFLADDVDSRIEAAVSCKPANVEDLIFDLTL